MVDEEIVAAGVTNPRVIASMRRTPRHAFVPRNQLNNAYDDMALPIGHSQTISPPFVVALNKIDRLFGWAATPNGAFQTSFEKQSQSVKLEFQQRLEATKTALAEQGMNAELCFNTKVALVVVVVFPALE